MLQRGPDGEAGGAHPAAVGDARSVVLALPVGVLALPVLLRLEEWRRVAAARPHVTALVAHALCWQNSGITSKLVS